MCAYLSQYLSVFVGGDRQPGAVPISISEHSVRGKISTMENAVGRRLGSTRQVFRNIGMPKD